jgi:hypothetical protein
MNMSDPTWLTLRLVGVSILFLPTLCNLLNSFLPKLLADLISVFITIVIALFVNDWLFQERNLKRLVKALRTLK